ncbi:MAG: hydro-lyase, Fe-S type, tartrate/fumarate subfamily, alpha subunit [Anaerospora sp.]|nr:hydro-lyase, Fe-S type, tartrate/fumarate subfamily, alpha subunit [Anaerospora sp.]
MNKEQMIQLMTETMTKFTGYMGKRLPDDVMAKLRELREQEDTAGSSLLPGYWCNSVLC